MKLERATVFPLPVVPQMNTCFALSEIYIGLRPACPISVPSCGCVCLIFLDAFLVFLIISNSLLRWNIYFIWLFLYIIDFHIFDVFLLFQYWGMLFCFSLKLWLFCLSCLVQSIFVCRSLRN